MNLDEARKSPEYFQEMLELKDEEIATLQAKLRESEAKCAEMRETLDRLLGRTHSSTCASAFQAETGLINIDDRCPMCSIIWHALSSDCGKGFVRVEELKPTITELRRLQDLVGEVDFGLIEAELARLEKLAKTQ